MLVLCQSAWAFMRLAERGFRVRNREEDRHKETKAGNTGTACKKVLRSKFERIYD